MDLLRGTSPDQLIPEESGWTEEERPHGFTPIAPSHLQRPQHTDFSRQRMCRGPFPAPRDPALAVLPGVRASGCEEPTNPPGKLISPGLIFDMQRSFDRLMFSPG